MAIPFIKHGHIGKTTQAQPYTAAAHLRYISRQSATVYRYAERMPLNYHAAQRFLVEREDTIRKNGRVIDKLTIALPREMTMYQAVDALRDFGFQLSSGRSPFYFSIQNWGEQNPHSHFIFVDADIDSGKRVFGTTDRDSTERIKALWEGVCNSHLQALGIDASISFDDAAEKKAQRLEAEEIAANQGPAANLPPNPAESAEVQANEVAGNLPPEAPSNELPESFDEPIPAEDDAEDALEGDEAMVLPIKKRLENARQDLREIRILDGKRREAVRLQADYVYWTSEAEAARQKAELAKDAQVDAVSRTQRASIEWKQTHVAGFRKGIHLRLFGFEIKTAGIEKAIQAEAEYEKATYAEALRGADLREADHRANRATQKVWEIEQKVGVVEQAISLHERINGVAEDFEVAEGLFKRSVSDNLEGLVPNDVMYAYDDGELTAEDAMEILTLMGHPELSAWIEAQLEEGLRH